MITPEQIRDILDEEVQYRGWYDYGLAIERILTLFEEEIRKSKESEEITCLVNLPQSRFAMPMIGTPPN